MFSVSQRSSVSRSQNTREGVATDPLKTDAVQKWTVPQTTQKVQGLLGLVGYYRKYNFAAIAKPLYRLTEKGREFKWTTECDAAFVELKSRLMSAPILAFPDFSKQFILDTDASDVGLGTDLSQVLHEGNEFVVAYARKTNQSRKTILCYEEGVVGSINIREAFSSVPS